ncbi:MAG TPA: hypothetical protein VGI39_44810 [Polyangiaceae bacterium]|jgi:nitrogen regulatory protein PII
MVASLRTAKVKLVTVIVPYERVEAFEKDLRHLGIRGYTSMTADGQGHHGPRTSGLFDSANVRFEILARPHDAAGVLGLVDGKYADEAVVAYATDVEAVPATRFE